MNPDVGHGNPEILRSGKFRDTKDMVGEMLGPRLPEVGFLTLPRTFLEIRAPSHLPNTKIHLAAC
jgi:hypothetical protein